MTVERRQHTRYILPGVEFQVFTRRAEILGKLEDISKGGLAFRFGSQTIGPLSFTTIDITATGPERFHLAELSCKQVYELSVLTEDQSFTGTRTRRCGVKFLGLNDVQEQQLDFLLDHYGFRLTDIP